MLNVHLQRKAGKKYPFEIKKRLFARTKLANSLFFGLELIVQFERNAKNTSTFRAM